MADLQALYNERVERMEKVYNRGIPDRVPVYSMVDNYAIHYAGYTLKEVIEDEEKQYRAYEKIMLDFFWDSTMYSGVTKAMKFFNKLGGGTFKVTDSLQVEGGAAEIMNADEYKELAKDPAKFMLNVLYPRKYGLFTEDISFEEKYKRFASAVDELFAFLDLGKRNTQRLKDEHGILVSRGATMFMPLDIILDFLRDFQGTMLDIRRRPQEVAEACDALADYLLQMIEDSYPNHIPGHMIFIPLHVPQFLRPKAFEQVYWPSFKKILDAFSKKGYKALCYFERNWEHLYDYLQELPKNTVVGLFEDDDIRKAKKELGHIMCIAGGMPVNKLMYGTKEECVDYTKSLLDDMAPGGGYIFCSNVILHNAKDAKPENLRAVNEYVRDNGKY
ncbi:uroporphyrinogen decarboxylase (URO-D) [Oxobacter pfennigii]|uniref:Uroporphyrinogen decarboxylase (URO-D) n=1 Tax=Oxobacter pfennigii TaxID=36849 RepID=A0A0P8YXL4_9CLOT|nr:uroporphyrinogen decarboxylase family protein [Oxobacter pfennigii]KPU44508.1 uroporphyrinogen decarboxylase (URO-D) [Oxobacter pfennigii]